MTLARAWRRQLFGASSAALLVPFAMFAALVVLALGGGFSQIGVLGQIFAGPPAPAPSVGGAASGHPAGATRLAASALPLIPGVAGPATRSPRGLSRAGHGGVVPLSPGRPGRTGGALAPVGGAAPIVTQGAGSGVPRPSPGPSGSTPSPSGSAAPPPSPSPQPQPTPVDKIVTAVTPVTQQLPAPAGPVVTQAVQAAGSAADSLLPPAPSPPQGPAVP